MANREHLAMLKKAVTVWNEWRELNPDTRPDLSGADLSRADLTRANLQGATLRGADPVEADLCQTTLFEPDFRGANFSTAYFVLADLTDAGLAEVNTEDTDLRYSQLIDQHIEYITDWLDAIAAQPEDSATFTKVAKKTAPDLIGSALKEVAKGQVKAAAKRVCELGKDLGPVVVNTAAYGFFKSCLG